MEKCAPNEPMEADPSILPRHGLRRMPQQQTLPSEVSLFRNQTSLVMLSVDHAPGSIPPSLQGFKT